MEDLKALSLEKTVVCKNCGEVEPVLSKKGSQLRADCSKCGQYVKFVRQKDADHLSVVKKLAGFLTPDQRREAIAYMESL